MAISRPIFLLTQRRWNVHGLTWFSTHDSDHTHHDILLPPRASAVEDMMSLCMEGHAGLLRSNFGSSI